MQDTHDRIEDINESFRGAWERNGGREQTRFFMNLILNNLPEDVFFYLRTENENIVDVGCALGDGCHLLAQNFTDAHIWGLDASSVAIEKARGIYGHYKNMTFKQEALSHEPWPIPFFDAVTCSNVLEHFSDPLPYFRDLLSMARRYAIILVPYNETDRIPGHRVTITEETFPEVWSGFRRIQTKVIDTGNNPYWAGPQILFVYEGAQTK
jgi:2-polyprenyl-3-methyl-5-hydroxy-6-metoxy-1,4-benzoquinol methylase